MKKGMILGITLAAGLLSIGALTASAADVCDKCTEKQAMQQFTKETETLKAELKAKDLELRGLYAYDSINIRKVNAIEADLKDIKDKIRATAAKHGITACNHS